SDLAGWDSSVMPVGSKLSGLDAKNPKMKGRIYNVLSPRPAIVEQIKKSDPDFNLEDFNPKAKK
ncbi:hypothetical protein N9221_00800, partial [Akkermansiaceae bacterium]|nr:hypothetical protein [Akkermansiaceae bacterium]